MGGRAKAQTILRPLPDDVIDALVCQAMTSKRNSAPQDKIRELVRLVEAELQGRLAQHEYYVRKRDAGVVAEIAETR